MKRIFFFLYFTICFLIVMSNVILADPLVVANIESVHSKSIGNALRNPAILPFQEKSSMFGAIVSLNSYYDTDSSGSLDFSFLDDTRISVENNSAKIASLHLSYTQKIGRSAFGIGLSTDELALYDKKESRTEVRGVFKGSGSSILFKEIETKTIFSPMLVLSAGRRIGKKSSFGIRFNMASKFEKIEKEGDVYFDEVHMSDDIDYSSEKKTKFTGEVVSGYFYKVKDSEVGLMLKSGKISYNNSKINYEKKEGSSHVKDDADYPFKTSYTDGSSLVIGIYSKVSNLIGITLEGGVQGPAYYKEKDFDNDDNYKVTESDVKSMPRVGVNGMIDFNFNSAVIGLGGGFFNMTNIASGEGDSDITTKMYLYLGAISLDCNLSDNVRLIMAGQFLILGGSTKMDSEKMNMDMDIKESNLNLIAGIAYLY